MHLLSKYKRPQGGIVPWYNQKMGTEPVIPWFDQSTKRQGKAAIHAGINLGAQEAPKRVAEMDGPLKMIKRKKIVK